jgi:hypothetical protein
MRKDLHVRRRLMGIGAGVVAFALFVLLSRAPAIAEMVYGALGPTLASALSRVTGVVPFSLAELVIVAFVARQLLGLARGWKEVRTQERAFGNALAGGALRLGSDLGIMIALFYLLWGFNYARPSLEDRAGWDAGEINVEEVATLAGELIEAANFEYATLHGSDDSGAPTTRPREWQGLEESLASGWTNAAPIVGPFPLWDFGYGRPKSVFASRLLDYFGVTGFYFPWTAEANVNGGMPIMAQPHSAAHEMAHQRGFAREDEANFVGFLVAASANDHLSRYSAYLFAQRQLLNALARSDMERAIELARQRAPGVQRDIDRIREYWEQFEGPARDAARNVNDAYLRTNRIPAGVLNYNRSLELLVAYARSRGGWLLRRERSR